MPSRHSLAALSVLAGSLVSLALKASSAAPNPQGQATRDRFAVHVMREEWSGLAGNTAGAAEPVRIPPLLWQVRLARRNEPEDEPAAPAVLIPGTIDPRDRRQIPARESRPKTMEFRARVVLMIIGKQVEYRPAPRASRVLESDFDGQFLSYKEPSGARELRLVETAGPTSEWLIRDATRTLRRQDRGVDGFQFEVRETARFRLEAASRPGWFLSVEDEELRLTRDPEARHWIELERRTHFDDLSDGR